MPQTLTQIKQQLKERGLHPKHRFGQNFLHDHNKLRQIINAAEIKPGELVLEVGPGTGALSSFLLEAGAKVITVEIDHDLAEVIRANFKAELESGQLTLLECDALAGKHDLAPAIDEVLQDRSTPFKLVANLPYNAASPLIMNLTRDYPGLQLGIILIQKEVAERLSASHGGKDYGPLGILIQTTFETDIVTSLPPACFWPAPKVTSAVARMRRREQALVENLPAFAEFVHLVFQQRRKQLGKILGRDHAWPEDISPTARPESLSLQQLIRLHALIECDK